MLDKRTLTFDANVYSKKRSIKTHLAPALEVKIHSETQAKITIWNYPSE